MHLNEKSEFPPSGLRLAALGKALSHPDRVSILKILADRDACVDGGIGERLSVEPSAMSEHLRELKEVGLVQDEIEGPRISYCLNAEVVSEMQGLLAGLFWGLTHGERRQCC